MPLFKELLQKMDDVYDIPNVNPEFVITADPTSSLAGVRRGTPNIEVIAVVDFVTDGQATHELLETAQLDESVADEFDVLSQKLVKHLRDTHTRGGLYCQEFYRYGQYVYSDMAPRHRKLILVDVEPIGFRIIPKPFERMSGSIPIDIIEAAAEIARDLIDLQSKTGIRLTAFNDLAAFVGSVENNGFPSMEEAKQRIFVALQQRTTEYLDVFDVADDDLFSDVRKFNSSEYVHAALAEGRYL